MKSFRKLCACLLAMGFALVFATAARGSLPKWIQNIEAGGVIESAFFRLMSLPGGPTLAPRPPRETRPALSELIAKDGRNADLYSLRAMEDEQALDFTAAATDWRKYAELSADRVQGNLALADFYHRRLRSAEEIQALTTVIQAPPSPAERLLPPSQQRAWLAFERIFAVVHDQNLPSDISEAQYRAWIARYPQEKQLYVQFFQFLLDGKNFKPAADLIRSYHAAFPTDDIFPVKAQALLDYKQGSVEQGLALYDKNFQPLWPPELVQSYFGLLKETRTQRKYLDQWRAALEANPDDLNSATRIFYYYQQQGRLDAAQQTLADFRLHKEQRNAPWSAAELFTLARLHEDIHAYPEAARYYYALYNSQGMNDAQERALAGLTDILLTAPEQSIRLGSGSLSMYRDIGAMDQGPGFLNGILSLILNSTSPPTAFSDEEQRAVPYFHRAEAAELLRMLDTRSPQSPRRPELHAKLIEAYDSYGENDAVIRDGREFLAQFAAAPQRSQVALLMADAYARTGRTQEEFAVYDSLLQELAKKSEGMPLGEAAAQQSYHTPGAAIQQDEGEIEEGARSPEPQPSASQRAFSIQQAATPAPTTVVRSPEYSRVLERYLSRLVSMKQIPEALAVLRKEIDRNPNDPGIYDRLAQFLEQNQLFSEQEETYRRAMQQFPDRSWYHRLARFYLRRKRDAEFEQLTREVVKIFSGTDLESYFNDVVRGNFVAGLNDYARQRFPHNLVFVNNLLGYYRAYNIWPKWEALIRQHWFEDDQLRSQFFEYLSRTGKLDGELAALNNTEKPDGKPWSDIAQSNPLAARFFAEAEFWQSHYESGAPAMGAMASEYPADSDVGTRASAVYRSLAAFDARDTQAAVGVEENLLKFNPGDRDRLARIGDILADRELFQRAAPYWNHMAEVHPGDSGGYLEAATVFWDYYRFDDALRLLADGRRKLADDNLYAYEAGAIYESKREYDHAVHEYVKGALAGGLGSAAHGRLIALARRPSLRATIDAETAQLADSSTPDLGALNLRLAVLEAENRQSDTEDLLNKITERTTSAELLENIEQIAQQRSLETVRQHALERQATLTTDPIRRLELRYSLVKFYEDKKDLAAAERNVEALYRENPKIMGVVRATADFYWRNKMQARAIAVLLQAAKDSYPLLKTQFTFEAARKATDIGQYRQARELLTGLLAKSPYSGEYLADMADTYARAGDNQGLRAFYLEKIDLFKQAQLGQDDKDARIAALRRGLIPALTRLKDYPGAVDQYIEIINKYPDDEALVTEAALYAQRYGRQPQLLDFYSKTVQEAPRDYRWPMVLARAQAQMENYPAAIDSYAKAVAIRPDRVDLRTASAGLKERLMRFDDAAADYERLYELTYRDPKWMEKVAEIRARQGKAEQVLAALKTALIDNRTEKPQNYFEAATRLESWGMLTPAREFAQKGVDAAGADLLALNDHRTGALLYIRIMTRLRRQDAAYQRLQAALHDADSTGAAVTTAAQQVAKQGIAAVTDSEWRERVLANRRETARGAMEACMREMGATVDRYFTPDEKAGFSTFLAARRPGMSLGETSMFILPAAEAAQLPALQAELYAELMMDRSHEWRAYEQKLISLQSKRLKFDELGQQLEHLASTLSYELGRDSVLLSAAQAYRDGGNDRAELAVLRRLEATTSGAQQQRYFQLLLKDDPQHLVDLAGSPSDHVNDPATDYAIAHGDNKLALAAVEARGRRLPPVWTKSYAGLAGLYLDDPAPAIDAAFLAALGNATIGERVSHPVDRNQQLAGNTWFYYGSRYGEYLGARKKDSAEDFLPAVLEESPASVSGYLTLAGYYADSGDAERAIKDYEHVLELNPNRADVHDHLAVLYWRQQKRDQAITEWKLALDGLSAQLDQRRTPESFWSNFEIVADHLGSRRLAPQFHAELDKVLRTYVRRNGVWRVSGLLQAAFKAGSDPRAGVQWLLDLASVAPDPAGVLNQLVNAAWIPLADREPIYERMLLLAQERIAANDGLAKQYAQADLLQLQIRRIRYLLRTRQYDRARAILDSVPSDSRQTQNFIVLQARIAAERNDLDALLSSYRATTEDAPNLSYLRSAAAELRQGGRKQAARKVLEYVFGREIEDHQLTAANLLGLAEIRIEDGDLPGGLELLHRATLVVGAPFENLDAAANVLVKTGHPGEADEFLSQLVKVTPWNPQYRLRLAQAKMAAKKDAESAHQMLTSIAASLETPYETRVEAARALNGTAAKLGSAELDLLTGGTIAPEAANKPFFYPARVKAAAQTTSPQTRIDLLRAAVEDRPISDVARVPLFHALAAKGQDQLAISAVNPLLRSGALTEIRARRPQIESADTEEELLAENEPQDLLHLPLAQRISLAAAVGSEYRKLEQLEQALQYVRIAARLEPDATKRKKLLSQTAEIRATIKRDAANAARRPQIHKDLEQSRLVRPRLLPKTAAEAAARRAQ